MDNKLRTRAEILEDINRTFAGVNPETLDALATLEMTTAELLQDLRQRYPNTCKDEAALLQYAEDEINLADALINGEWEAAAYYDLAGDEQPAADWMPELPTNKPETK